MTDGANLGERAVVVGGGMGGLFAARVLSDHFDEVVVVDRDHEPSGGASRKMMPQGDHFHVLLPGGPDAMTEWFPGFVDDLVDTGSVELQLGRDFYAYTPMGKSYSLQAHVPVDGGAMIYVQTRPQFEANVRRRVEGVDNITVQFRTLIDGPLVEDGRIVGVSVCDGDDLHADLVADASGRNSLTAQWLPGLGYDKAPETYVNCDVRYASAVGERGTGTHSTARSSSSCRRARASIPPGAGPSSSARPGSSSSASARVTTTRYRPTAMATERSDARTLITSLWDELVDDSTQLTDVKTYRMPRAVRHHYEQVARSPEGLLPIGDSLPCCQRNASRRPGNRVLPDCRCVGAGPVDPRRKERLREPRLHGGFPERRPARPDAARCNLQPV